MLLNTVVKSVKRKSHRGDQVVTSDQITTDIIACANEAIRDCYKLLPKRFLWKQGAITTSEGVSGTPAIYSLASDVQEPIAFYYTHNLALYTLRKMDSDYEWINSIWSPATSTNKPVWYREIGLDSGNKQIELFPIPNDVYVIIYEYYKGKPTDLLVADLSAEIPGIPDIYQDVIEKGALYYFLKGFDDHMQQVAKADYEASKMAMNIGDEEDKDSNIAFRFQGLIYPREPGFKQ